MLRSWLRYKFDSSMSRGMGALIAWLFVFSAVFAGAVALFTIAFEPRHEFLSVWWLDFQATSNLKPGSGTLASILGRFLPALGGMFMGGLLTGLIVGSIQNKIRNLRKGRSVVVEKNHQVILGWSDAVFTVVHELALANASEKSHAIVILADKDKIDMEDAIRHKVPRVGRTKIVCRTGNPVDPHDLHITNPHLARSFVVLSPEGEDPDAQVIKIMLSLVHNPEVSPRSVVAEMRDPNRIEAARLLSHGEVRLLSMDDLTARITVQACRQAGASLVYASLLTFDGDELYVHAEPSLIGKTVGEAQFAYETSSVVGIVRERKTIFNPPSSERLVPGDRLIILARDEHAISLATGPTARALVEEDRIAALPHERQRRAARVLFLGWNRRAPATIRHLDEQVAPGSVIDVVADLDGDAAMIERACPGVQNATLGYRKANIAHGDELRALGVERYDHVVVLGYSDRLSAHEADAQTLVTLVFLRAIREDVGVQFSIVAEMLEAANRKLAAITRADDFVVSTQLVSQMLAQMSENPDLTYNELFEADGSEIDLRPIEGYVTLGRPVCFATVIEAAHRRGEAVIGYRVDAEGRDSAKNYGIYLNPAKSMVYDFVPGDRVIVIAPN